MLTEALTAMSAAGGAAVVQAAGTDAWTGLRHRVAALLGRGDPRREQAELDRLDQTAATLASTEPGTEAGTREAAAWQVRFGTLLESLDGAAQDRAATEIQALIEEVGATITGKSVARNTFVGPTVFQVGDGNHQDNRFGA